jgi:chromosome transmission fidelity protein 1
MTDLGQVIYNLCNICPDGVVVFFPSYAFLGDVKKIWQESGLLERFGGKKKVWVFLQETCARVEF